MRPVTTHDLGRFFWHGLQEVRMRWPLRRDHTWEVEEPYRFSRSLVIRLWPTNYGIVLGWWRDLSVNLQHESNVAWDEATEGDMAYDAYVAVNGPVPREQWQDARREVAGLGLSPDEEMERMQQMGVFL